MSRYIYFEAFRQGFTDADDGEVYEDTELEICMSRADLVELLDAVLEQDGDDMALVMVGCSSLARLEYDEEAWFEEPKPSAGELN